MAEVQPPLTAPVEESIGPRDLTHWHTRLGRRLVDLVSSLVGVAHRWTMLVTLLVAGLVVVGLTALSSEVYSSVTDDGELAGLDQPVLDAAVARRTPFNQTALTVFTDIGGPVGMPMLATALVALMVWRWKSWSPLVLTLAAAAGSLAMTTVGKHLIGRSRPPRELAVPPFESSPSFPSGHTLNAHRHHRRPGLPVAPAPHDATGTVVGCRCRRAFRHLDGFEPRLSRPSLADRRHRRLAARAGVAHRRRDGAPVAPDDSSPAGAR